MHRGSGTTEGEGFRVSEPLRSFAGTVRRVLLEPGDFFGNMALKDSLWNPLAFAMACGVISSLLLTSLVGPLASLAGIGRDPGFEEVFGDLWGRSMGASAALVLVVVVLTPLFILLGLYVGAAVYHFLVSLIVGKDNTGFDATLRIYAYSSVVTLLAWIPGVGYLATLYGYYLAFLGVREVHSTTTGRALGVVLVPLAIRLLLLFGEPVLRLTRV